MDKLELGNRMKEYENVTRTHLTRRVPVIIRIDGKAFHTFTKSFGKPFDAYIQSAMDSAAYACAEAAQGCKVAYVQSDEISLLLTDYERHETSAWFDYNIQKLVSVSSSIATHAFTHQLYHELDKFYEDVAFDARVFNIPKEEVSNYFVWRAKDNMRNSINLYAQSFFSAKQMHGKKIPQVHDMLKEIGKNWTTDVSERNKNGCFYVYDDIHHDLVGYDNIDARYETINNLISKFI